MEALDINHEILNQLAALNAKLDRLDGQVQQINRRQRAMEDLVEEFGPLAKEVYHTLLMELEAVEDSFSIDDVVHLARKLLRNTRRFSEMLDLLGSVHDFLQDATPLGKDVFHMAVEKLDQLERMGAFDFAREAMNVAETVMRDFTPQDVALLAQNISSILKTTRSLTQPDVLRMVNTSLATVRTEEPRPLSLFGMLRAINDPQVRQGLTLTLAMVRQFPAALGQPALIAQDDLHLTQP